MMPVSEKCMIPPKGWRCTREKGHDGPCAAVKVDYAAAIRNIAAFISDDEESQPTASAEARECCESNMPILDIPITELYAREIASLQERNAALESSVARLTQERDGLEKERNEYRTNCAMQKAQILDAEDERDEAITSRAFTQQWYAERWQWLDHWFHNEGKDLPIADQYWSIKANGTPGHTTPPTYQQILNGTKHKLDAATKRAEAAEANVKLLIADWAEDDTAIRDLCRPYLTEQTCDHDGYAMVPLAEAVGNAIRELKGQLDKARGLIDALANATDGSLCRHIKNVEGCWACHAARKWLNGEKE